MKRGTVRQPKLLRLARRLGIEPWAAVGLLDVLLDWAYACAPRGDVGRHEDADIAEGIGWKGDPAVLIEALVQERWLDQCSENRLVIHDLEDHADRTWRQANGRHERTFVRAVVHTKSSVKPQCGVSESSVTPPVMSGQVRSGQGKETDPAARAAAPAKKAPREKPPTDPRVSPLMRHFDAAFRAKTGKPYAFRGAAEATSIRRLPAEYDLATLTGCVERYFKTADPFTRDAGYSFGLFVSRLPALLAKPSTATAGMPREFADDAPTSGAPCPPEVRAALASAATRDKPGSAMPQTTPNLPPKGGVAATIDPNPVSGYQPPSDRASTGLS